MHKPKNSGVLHPNHFCIQDADRVFLKGIEGRGDTTMIDWKKMKADISKGIKEGAETVGKKAEELTTEGQRKINVFNHKKHIQEKIEELGAEIYNAEKLTPGAINHEPSMAIFAKIESLSAELKELEKKK
jgi:formyltetrahydrofolate synthetase